jgi:hypothetical protein
MSILKVHRVLTPDSIFFVMPEVSPLTTCGDRLKRASSAFVSGFPLKDCGNDNFNMHIFYATLPSNLEQKPNTFTDRNALDIIVFDSPGLTEDKRNEVYYRQYVSW